jgi:hypothetical protein
VQSNALFSLLPNVFCSFYAVFFVLLVRGLITRGLEVKVFLRKMVRACGLEEEMVMKGEFGRMNGVVLGMNG